MNRIIEKKSRKKKWLIIVFSIIGLLIIVRLMLPYIVLKYVNKTLSEMKEYRGNVEDIDIALIRGAYVINNIQLDKVDSLTNKVDSIAFFRCAKIDLSVEWRAIFKGKIVGEIFVENPILNFVKGKHKNENVKADTTDFQTVIRKLMPLTINHFEINNGQIHYIDKYSNPLLHVAMKNVMVKADNLSNVNDSNKLLPASLIADADLYEGKLKLNLNFNALEKKPTFDLNARLTSVNMVLLNDFFKAYGNFDVKKGNFGLYTEFAAKEGKFKGYVKPIIKDLDIVQWNKQEGDVVQILWESLIGSVAELFQNQGQDQFATKLPIEGKFDDPNTSLWTAINYVLRNAFVNALRPSVDNSINIGKVEDIKTKKTFLQKIFGKKDKKVEKE